MTPRMGFPSAPVMPCSFVNLLGLLVHRRLQERMSVPVETMRAPMAMNSAASFGLVDSPPTPTCLPCFRQAAMVFS